MEINIGMSECHKNVDNYYGSNITVWIPRCAGREAFDGVEPLPEYQEPPSATTPRRLALIFNPAFLSIIIRYILAIFS